LDTKLSGFKIITISEQIEYGRHSRMAEKNNFSEWREDSEKKGNK